MRIGLGTSLVCLIVGMTACSGGGTNRGTNDSANTSAMSNAGANGDGGIANGTTTAASNEVSQTRANASNPLLNRKRRPGLDGDAGPEVPLDFRPGAENSETATTMNAQGQPVEVRVFKDHPQLSRAEAVWLGANGKLLRITLRDGTTVEVKTDRIANLSSAPSDLLVELAGGSK